MSNPKFENLERSIAGLIQSDDINLENLEQYLDTAMYWAKLAVLPPIFDQMITAGFTPDELVYGLAQYSYRWGFDGITGRLETISNDLEAAIKERKTAQSSTES